MKKMILFCSLLCIGFSQAHADAVPGQKAPAFDVVDSNGKAQKLSAYKGKWLVLEWFNKDCPYVKKHYNSGNMQKLQKQAVDKGAVWLTILSSAQGKQGHMEAAELNRLATEKNVNSTAMLIDASGTMGKAYGAKTTPHMFIINPEGNVVYAGAIDDNDSADPAVIAKSKNYVSQALESGMAGKKIETATSRPYGCAVKYN